MDKLKVLKNCKFLNLCALEKITSIPSNLITLGFLDPLLISFHYQTVKYFKISKQFLSFLSKFSSTRILIFDKSLYYLRWNRTSIWWSICVWEGPSIWDTLPLQFVLLPELMLWRKGEAQAIFALPLSTLLNVGRSELSTMQVIETGMFPIGLFLELLGSEREEWLKLKWGLVVALAAWRPEGLMDWLGRLEKWRPIMDSMAWLCWF